ncbi:hypothetical protein C1H46_003726 [Malus baccata]|uniref:Nodulin-like domain-containing protein n=1 Tax=Malus baccata TaxID=106549 RepID=A0A540NJ17_MALBA|nr:hypothetical protein C1H46_003726 [Malus baccata]
MGFASDRSSISSATKWLGFVTAVWVQAISGNNYTFSNYSDALMSLTQLELNNLSVAKDVAKAFSLLAGLASDKLPTWVILLIGSVEGLVGYGAQWLIISERIKPLSYWQMCIFLCMGGNSTTWMNTAILVTCIQNFRQNRATWVSAPPSSPTSAPLCSTTTSLAFSSCLSLKKKNKKTKKKTP